MGTKFDPCRVFLSSRLLLLLARSFQRHAKTSATLAFGCPIFFFLGRRNQGNGGHLTGSFGALRDALSQSWRAASHKIIFFRTQTIEKIPSSYGSGARIYRTPARARPAGLHRA